MADHSSGPPGPEDHYRFQDDEPPQPSGGSAPEPKPRRKPERARRPRPTPKDHDEEKTTGWTFPSPAKPQPMGLTQKIVLAVLGVAVVVFIVVMAVWQNQRRSWEQTNFGAAMDEYLAPTVAAAPGAPTPTLGKLVIIDADERKVDYLQESVPAELRAASPAEVQTVVQFRRTQQEVGRYLGGGRALKVTVNVTVVDRASHVVLGTRTFVGADPPAVTVGNASDDVRGAVPYADIISYLKELRKGS